ncbi:MAG TPA: YciI family protein [Bryobacteraceae bacterium]|jgi:hypothetical protein
MRYMMLIYSKESPDGLSPEDARQIRTAHWKTMDEAVKKGILVGAEPLAPTATATTVRMRNSEALVTDGPFAETKEQLAGYYILECENLDDAIEWAAKIPTGCKGREGCIEIRPMPGLPTRINAELAADTD